METSSFGPCCPTPEQIFEIIDDVAKAQAAAPCQNCRTPSHGCDCSTGWKLAICTAFDQRFKNLGTGIRSFFNGASEPEFVLDFVLLEADKHSNGDPANITRTILGMEVEWNVTVSDAKLERDFNKLLCFNAPLKVFVYSCDQKKQRDFMNSIALCLRRFCGLRDGEQYLIVNFYKSLGTSPPRHWCPDKKQFRIENGLVIDESAAPRRL